MKPADLSSLKQLLLWHHHNGRESQWMEEDERRGERGKKRSTTPPAAFLLSAVNNRLDQQTSDSSLSTVINRHQGQAIRDPFTLQVLQVVTCLTHVMLYDIVMLWQTRHDCIPSSQYDVVATRWDTSTPPEENLHLHRSEKEKVIKKFLWNKISGTNLNYTSDGKRTLQCGKSFRHQCLWAPLHAPPGMNRTVALPEKLQCQWRANSSQENSVPNKMVNESFAHIGY